MALTEFDVVVIGAGPAGEKAAIQAAELGAKVAIIEKASQPGGAGVNTGTIPSKAIRETILFISQLKRKDLSGFEVIVPHQLSVNEVFHRQQSVSSEMAFRIYKDLQEKGITYYQGFARFNHPGELVVTSPQKEEIILKTRKTIIAVGTQPYHPPGIDFKNPRILDSDSILHIGEIPRSLVVYGGGVIGCEYATMFTRLGTRVYLVSPKQKLLDFIDQDLSFAMNYLMLQAKITLRLGEEYQNIVANDHCVTLSLQSGKVIQTDYLLYANGRQGNTQGLNLDRCSIQPNSRQQINVNNHYLTDCPNIYAVGDIIGFPSLVSTGNEQGRRAAQHAVTGQAKPLNAKNIPLAVYTIPEIAMVGLTEDALTVAGVDYETGTCHFRDLARARLIGEEDGLLKLIFSPKDRKLLGVHIIGYHASDLIHIGQAVLHYEGTIDYFLEEVINFPTFSSGYKVAAIDALQRTQDR